MGRGLVTSSCFSHFCVLHFYIYVCIYCVCIISATTTTTTAPESASQHFRAANIKYGQGEYAEAERLYLLAIKEGPNVADHHCNYGALLVDKGENDKAQAAYRYALNLDAKHAPALFNLAMLLQEPPMDTSALTESADLYARLVEVEPKNFDAWSNYGTTLHQLGVMEGASAAYQQALDVFPTSGGDAGALSRVLEHLGRVLLRLAQLSTTESDLAGDLHSRAIAALTQAVQVDPNNKIAKHMLAANRRDAGSGDDEAIAPREYVKKIFDDYSSTFEVSLERLGYRAPALIASHLTELGVTMSSVSVLLDLGCGTGLLPPALNLSAAALDRPLIIGIDLSPGMLSVAEEKGVYDHLYAGEIVTFLNAYADHLDQSCRVPETPSEDIRRKLSGSIVREFSSERGFDETFKVTEEIIKKGKVLVAAADVLVYMGDLKPFFNSLARALRSGDVAAFSTEAAESNAASGQKGWHLGTSGRYAHTSQYMRDLAKSVGLEVSTISAVSARRELDKDVAGWLVVLKGR